MLKLAELNALERDKFTSALAGVFEYSPWIAAKTADARPFTSLDDLHAALCRAVLTAGDAEKLTLIRAHPDLASQRALTDESRREQSSAGLTQLSAGDAEQFRKLNARYRERFGFPFIICARMATKDAMLDAMAIRLQNSKSQEMDTALGEIFKIARLRLEDMVKS